MIFGWLLYFHNIEYPFWLMAAWFSQLDDLQTEEKGLCGGSRSAGCPFSVHYSKFTVDRFHPA